MNEDWKARGDMVGKVQQECLCQEACKPHDEALTQACWGSWPKPEEKDRHGVALMLSSWKALLAVNSSAHIAQMHMHKKNRRN